jgi:hypothetical protein
MGTEKKLTLNDPVDPKTLRRIGDIQNRRDQIANALLDLEQEKIRILVEGRRLDDERDKLFAHIVLTRGLLPGTTIEIEPETGKIVIVKGRPSPQPPEPSVEPEQPAPAPAPASAEPPPA